MIRAQILLVAALVFCATFSGVYSTISCYLCNSYTDADHTACVDPMSDYPAVNYTYCNDNYVCTRVSYITQKTLVVSRGCDPAGKTCTNIYNSLAAYYPDLSSFNCYSCGTNYCNDASGLKVEGTLNATSKLLGPSNGKKTSHKSL